jgi:hypothetical protein
VTAQSAHGQTGAVKAPLTPGPATDASRSTTMRTMISREWAPRSGQRRTGDQTCALVGDSLCTKSRAAL